MSNIQGPGDKPRELGLKAIRDVRVERERSRHGRITGKVWLVGAFTVLTVVAGAFLFRDRSLSQQKEELLAKQRAALTTVGAQWFPLRDRLEQNVLAQAGEYKGDYVDPDAAKWDFRTLPGIYLRLPLADVKDAASIRAQADNSLKDAFVGCLFREDNPSALQRARGDMDGGLGWQDQPWNLRLGYYATRFLTDDWVKEVREAEDEIHLRVFVQQYEKATREELPLAIDMIKRAQFFLVVLDEEVPEAKSLAPTTGKNAGKVTGAELQQLPHPARISLLGLKANRELFRLRRESTADYRFATGPAQADPLMAAALRRQVNNCQLASDVWAAVGPEKAAAKPAEPAVGDAGPGPSGDAGGH